MKYHLWAFWSIVKTNIRNCLLSNGDIFSTHGERESSCVVNDVHQTLPHVPWWHRILQIIIFLQGTKFSTWVSTNFFQVWLVNKKSFFWLAVAVYIGISRGQNMPLSETQQQSGRNCSWADLIQFLTWLKGLAAKQRNSIDLRCFGDQLCLTMDQLDDLFSHRHSKCQSTAPVNYRLLSNQSKECFLVLLFIYLGHLCIWP